jgi:lysophospholipase L1-like esterase
MLCLNRSGRALLGLTALSFVAAGCFDDDAGSVLGPRPDDLFRSYVALGNSITAGFQSGGINDSTQRRAYPVLLATQMGTRFAYPSLAGRGCAPPIANFLTQVRVGTGSTSTTCDLRNPATTDIINNLGVPGATVADPTAESGSTASNILTSLILGGQTQVERALQAEPTFASIWIGNNDVLPAAVSGILVPFAGVSPGVTSQTTFEAEYNEMIDQLLTGVPQLEGALVGVVEVANAPIFFPAAALLPAVPANPAFAGFQAATGYNATGTAGQQIPLTVDANCTGSAALVSFRLASQIALYRANPAAAGAHPPHVACGTPATGYPAPVGEIFILTAAEQTALENAVTAYNAYISDKASDLGWAYMNPNVLLDSLRTAGQIPVFPNLASGTATFGTWVSLDGVHPSSTAHRAITNHLIDAINETYNTNLSRLSVP